MTIDRHYPVGVCKACNQFIQTTFVLKSIYDGTNELLKKLFNNSKQQASIENEVCVIYDSDEEVADRNCIDSEDRNADIIDSNNFEDDEKKVVAREDLKNEQKPNNSTLLTFLNRSEENVSTKRNLSGETEKGNRSNSDSEIDYPDANCEDSDRSEDILDSTSNSKTRNYFKNEQKLQKLTSRRLTNRKQELVCQKEKLRKRRSRKKKENHNNSECETEDDNRNEGIRDSINYEEDENEINTDKKIEDEIDTLLSRNIVKFSGKPLKEQNYLCPFCASQFSTPTELIQHSHKHKLLKKYLIKDLKMPRHFKFFAKPRTTHTIFSKSEILHKCMFCDVESPIESLKDHIVNHFHREEFPCNRCDKVFRKLHHLNIHVSVMHLEGMTYKCKTCNKQFCNKYPYECHLLTHRKEPHEFPHACEVCGKRFANIIHLQRHSFRHTVHQSFKKYYRIHRCSRCQRTFSTANELTIHKLAPIKCQPVVFCKKVSTGSRPSSGASTIWKCDLCPKTYASSSGLHKHKHVRHGPRKVCELCGAKIGNLTAHMKMHAPKQEPLECNICQKKLASKVTLIKHLRVHTGERPYQCKYCEKRFKDIHSKCVHQRIHEGIKKYICPICSKGFLEKSYMHKHLLAVHKLFPIYTNCFVELIGLRSAVEK